MFLKAQIAAALFPLGVSTDTAASFRYAALSGVVLYCLAGLSVYILSIYF